MSTSIVYLNVRHLSSAISGFWEIYNVSNERWLDVVVLCAPRYKIPLPIFSILLVILLGIVGGSRNFPSVMLQHSIDLTMTCAARTLIMQAPCSHTSKLCVLLCHHCDTMFSHCMVGCILPWVHPGSSTALLIVRYFVHCRTERAF